MSVMEPALLASVDRRVVRLSTSWSVRRIAKLATAAGATREEVTALQGIAITEMSARPLDARFIEWAFVLPLRRGLLGRPGRVWASRRTVGQLQLRDGPFGLRTTVRAALSRLRVTQVDVASANDLALSWHGPATEQTGIVPYRHVLRRSMDLTNPVAGTAQESQ